MKHQELERATKRREKARAPRDLVTGTPGAVQAPAVSVTASTDLDQVPTTASATDPLTVYQITVVGIYFFFWYALHLGHVFFRSLVLEEIYLPWTISAAELVIGSAIALHLWVSQLRPTPRLTMANVKIIAPIALCHTLSHVCAVPSLEDWEYYFSVQFIVASQPLVAVLLSTLFLKETFSRWVYLTLVPVIAGVTLVCIPWFVGDMDLTSSEWAAFAGGVGVNLTTSTRAVLSKRAMQTDLGKDMSPANLFAIVTIMASVMFLPLSIIMEGSGITDLWTDTFGSLQVYGLVAILPIVFCGVFFHLYNEVTFRCLGLVRPLTHAVGGTIEAICVFVSMFVSDGF